MKTILGIFGLVRIKDVESYLEDEANHFKELREKLTGEESLYEWWNHEFHNKETCCRSLKLGVFLINKR